MSSLALNLAQESFADLFGENSLPSFLAQAPGRVELLGNHTDYNGGLVLSAAIDRHTVVIGRLRDDRRVKVVSVGFQQDHLTDEFPIDDIPPGEPGDWGRYVRGVVWAFQERFGPLKTGFEAVITSDVPVGAGLSSSASLQAALGMLILRMGQGAQVELDDAQLMDLARTLQRSENAFVGVASGLLDQFSVLFGQRDCALRLDCRSLEHERLPLGNPAPAIVICDSRTSRRLADGMYNLRREECERVVAYFNQRRGESVKTLRDIPLADLEEHWEALDPVGRLRARHVLAENARVERGTVALRRGDVAELGHLMSASHASSRQDFENSSPALDALMEAAIEAPGFLGGKLSGAGWAGCTVNLVEADQARAFAEAVQRAYEARIGIKPEVHICRAEAGAWAMDREAAD